MAYARCGISLKETDSPYFNRLGSHSTVVLRILLKGFKYIKYLKASVIFDSTVQQYINVHKCGWCLNPFYLLTSGVIKAGFRSETINILSLAELDFSIFECLYIYFISVFQ